MIKLMVVDDEKTTRDGLIDCVPWCELGVEVIAEAEDGIIALDLALQTEPDIIFTDVKMPRMNGIELAEHLKDRLPACKIIFLSGYSDKEYLKSAIQLQAVDYIEKPVDIEEVKKVIRKTVAICQDEQRKKQFENQLQDKASENKFFLKEKLIWELINASEHPKDLSDSFLDLNLKDPVHDQVIAVIITLNSFNNFNIRIHRSTIVKKIEQEFTTNFLHCISGFLDNNAVILFIYGKAIEPFKIKTILEKIRTDIDQLHENNYLIFIGIGKSVTGSANAKESYQTALMVVQTRFFTGYNQIKFYESKPSRTYEFDNTLIEKFQGLINSDKADGAIVLINQIIDTIRQCEATSINLIKNFFLQMVLALSKIAKERNMLIGEPAEQFSWNTIAKSTTLQEIQTYLIQEVKQFFKVQADQDHKSNVVCNIFKYVQQNYHNKNLSIKDISEQLFLTPNYLCLLFKKETGKTINQYITEIRIEKAKELLKDRRIKLYEVAELLGYSDPNYFSKIFKKMTNLNPSEFRERNLS